MITGGHSWPSIQQYSLAEIGIFFKVVIQQEKDDRKENITNAWMGANLKHEGLTEVLNSIDTDGGTKKITSKKVDTEWRRLASFMAGKH